MAPDDRDPRRDGGVTVGLHDSPAHLAQAFSLGPRGLFRTWFRTVTAGELVGFCIPAAVGVLAFQLGPVVSLVAMVVAGAFEGLVLGAAQAHVLRLEFLGFSRSDWILATSLGGATAWFLGMLPSTFYGTWKGWPLALTIPVGAVIGSLLLLSIGIAQWFVLNRYVARAWIWVVANVAAWGAGLLVFAAVTMPLWREGQGDALVFAIGALGGLTMAATMAFVTGLFLVRVVLQPRRVHRGTPVGVPERDWAALAASTDHFRVFDPTLVEDLPQPVQRWLLHSITPGTPLLTSAEAEMHGQIRLGRAWRSFRALQRISMHRGLLWAARTRVAGLPVRGYDRYTRGSGEMHWRLPGRAPVMSASDDTVTRSAAGRHAGEVFALLPAAALDQDVTWEPVDDFRANAYLVVGGEQQRVTVTIAPTGQLRQLELQRWGTPPDSDFGLHRFGAAFDAEGRFDGYLVPTAVTAGWFVGTEHWQEGRFLRYHVTGVTFG